jgi:hypothetical protein
MPGTQHSAPEYASFLGDPELIVTQIIPQQLTLLK